MRVIVSAGTKKCPKPFEIRWNFVFFKNHMAVFCQNGFDSNKTIYCQEVNIKRMIKVGFRKQTENLQNFRRT